MNSDEGSAYVEDENKELGGSSNMLEDNHIGKSEPVYESVTCSFSGCAMNFRCFSLVCPDYI
jgi:hypothetical protein